MTKTNTMNRSSIGFSQIPDKQVFEYDRTFGANHYGRLEVVVRKAEGLWLTDVDGNKYFDCLAAYSAANPGHCHPRIAQALIDALQGGYASVISNVIYTDTRTLFLKKLTELIPQIGPRFGANGNKGLCKNGGVESVETAIKMARYYGWKVKGIPDGKQELIVFSNNFHGRMIAVVSFSSSKKYKEGFPEGFLKGLRDLSDKNDLFLVFDEIQVGLGRTGKMFCFEHEDVVPDGLVLGKALSGGLVPLSAFVTNSKMMDLAFHPGSDGSTFGGYPLACVAGIAALEVVTDEDLAARSAEMGAILKKKIDDIASRSSHVKEVRGKGLFIGIEVKSGDAMVYCRKLLDLGLLANDSHGHTIRISPPLVLDENDIDYICERLEKVLVD
jgi:ornithine--oxo-acid transaminase